MSRAPSTGAVRSAPVTRQWATAPATPGVSGLEGLTLRLVSRGAHEAPAYYVQARLAGRDVLLVIDSAFARSYVTGPLACAPSQPGRHHVELGGRTFEVDRLTDQKGDHSIVGMPVVGAIGADVLMSGTVVLDPARQTLEFRSLSPAERAASWGLRLSVRPTSEGYWYADVHVDGQRRRLWVDTGSPHTLLLRTSPRPGDSRGAGVDLSGTEVPLYEGGAVITAGTQPPRRVRLWRCPSWPGLEARVHGLGYGFEGLLGLSTLGSGKLIFLGPEGTICCARPTS